MFIGRTAAGPRVRGCHLLVAPVRGLKVRPHPPRWMPRVSRADGENVGVQLCLRWRMLYFHIMTIGRGSRAVGSAHVGLGGTAGAVPWLVGWGCVACGMSLLTGWSASLVWLLLLDVCLLLLLWVSAG